MTITEFLLARISEDERRMMAAWHDLDCPTATAGGLTCTCGAQARVLTECEAKRQIVELHQPIGPGLNIDTSGYGGGGPVCDCCGEPEWYCVAWPCDTLKALVLPYADHPDFREEW